MTSNHVLIIDPDRDFAESTRKFLRAQGFQVSCVSNGKQAIKKINPGSTLVALLCLELPDMKWQDLLIRINEVAPDLAVIATSLCQEEENKDLIDLGVIDFFSKPINQSDLLESIRSTVSLFQPMRMEMGIDEDSLVKKFFPFLIHELRNPLQAIGGAVSIIEKRSDLNDKPLSQSIQIIKEEVQYINGFIQNCLDFIRPSNKNFWIEFDLTELVSQCLNRLAYIFENSFEGISINTYFEPSLPKVYANYEEIKEVVLNLLKNAVEAMDQSDTKVLMIRVTHKGLSGSGWADVRIQDQGRGIRQDQVENLGTPFFTTKLRGTGLGLAICHKIIVERHKGKMMIERLEDQGTAVTIKLPVRSAPRAT
jgi:signal transduction histidine kinase